MIKTILALFMMNSMAFANTEIAIDSLPSESTLYNQSEQMSPLDYKRYSYNFGTVWLNSQQSIRYKFTNSKTTEINFKLATISGAGYRANHTCTGTLKPQEVCYFTIVFSPSFEGMNSGQFILSFKENYSIIVDLWGTGVRL